MGIDREFNEVINMILKGKKIIILQREEISSIPRSSVSCFREWRLR